MIQKEKHLHEEKLSSSRGNVIEETTTNDNEKEFCEFDDEEYKDLNSKRMNLRMCRESIHPHKKFEEHVTLMMI